MCTALPLVGLEALDALSVEVQRACKFRFRLKAMYVHSQVQGLKAWLFQARVKLAPPPTLVVRGKVLYLE